MSRKWITRILIIDDDELFCEALKELVKSCGIEADGVFNLEEAKSLVQKNAYDIIFLDIHLPDGNGLEMLNQFKDTESRPEVMIITGSMDKDGAKIAIENGAWDYIRKGDSLDRIQLSLNRAIEYRNEKMAQGKFQINRGRIIGKSPALTEVIEDAARAAASQANVLITGPTGTGKELVARTIHENSRRKDKPFVVVDCTVLTETLVESTLFGHEKGAFTGADKEYTGLVRQADGGTLFLDEIGELPLSIQKSFLRVLQEKKFRPVGGRKEVKSDFRLISATNRNLDAMAENEKFREDLLYRIRAISIHIPPLAERKADLRLLVHHYVDELATKAGLEIREISPMFFEAVESYHWPGNVRELIQALESTLSDCYGGTLIPQFLPRDIRIHAKISELNGTDENGEKQEAGEDDLPPFKEYRNQMTRKYLEKLVSITNGNIRDACRISGFSRSRLYELLKENDISL